MSPGPRTENSWYCVFVLLVIVLTGTFTVSNGLTGLNPLTPSIERTYTEIYQSRYGEEMPESTWTLLLSVTMSMTYVGGFVGSLLINLVLRWLSRKKALLVIYLTNSTGLIIVAIGLKGAMSYEMVIVGRILVGVSIGLAMSIIPLFLNEISVPHRRQFYGALYGAILPFGGATASFIAWSKIFGSYELLLGALLYGLLFTIIFLVCVHWIPETPYQTYLRHGHDVALETLRKLRIGDDDQLQKELDSLHGSTEKTSSDNFSDIEGEATIKEILTTPQYRKHFFSVVAIFSLIMACGTSNVMSFADKIFIEAGLPPDVVTPATIGIYLASALASGAAIVAMMKFDSRTLVIFFNVFIVLSHALMTTSIQTSKQVPAMSWASLAAMYIFMTAFGVLNTVSFAVMGTLCVDRTRSLSLLVGGAAFWFTAWLVGFMSPYLSVWIQGYAFLIWMAMTILGIVHFVFFVPRTKGKTEDEIQAFFKR